MPIRPPTIKPVSYARQACLWAVVLFLGLVPVFAANDVYVQTVVDPSGQLHITTKRHREIVPRKEARQIGFDSVQIAPGGRAVGWVALFPDSADADPIPSKVVILVNGRQRDFTGTGLPIARWCFWAGGKLVAFEQETLHGGMAAHYELRDAETGELTDKYDPDANPDAVTKPPKWVVELDAYR